MNEQQASSTGGSTILVTGGTGFLGAYILQELIDQGYQVKAIRRSQSQLPMFVPASLLEKIEWVEGDVLDIISLLDAMDNVHAVIHCAAVVSFQDQDKQNMYQVNIEGTANVVNAALEKKIARLVHISSVASLGRKEHGGTVNEEKKWEDTKVNTHYAKSKYKGELEVWRGFSEGLSGVILNPSTILGYGDWNSSSCAIFKSSFQEFGWYTAGINGFVDVEDVARAAVLLMASKITEERFVVNSENWSFQQLQDTIAAGFNKKKPGKKASPKLLALAWRWEKLKSFFGGHRPLLTRESARVAVSQTYFENDKIRRALPGFSFRPLRETIEASCKKYLSRA